MSASHKIYQLFQLAAQCEKGTHNRTRRCADNYFKVFCLEPEPSLDSGKYPYLPSNPNLAAAT